MKYKKKPVVIEAIQFTRDKQEEMKEFTEGLLYDITIPRTPNGIMTATVKTLEGSYTATEKDYIVKGVQGEFYPVKPDIFKETYEKVEEK